MNNNFILPCRMIRNQEIDKGRPIQRSDISARPVALIREIIRLRDISDFDSMDKGHADNVGAGVLLGSWPQIKV